MPDGAPSPPRQLRRELQASEERFRLLVDSVRDYAIFMLDPRGYVSSWNRGAQRIKGYTADEIVGRHFSVFYPPEDIVAGKTKMELEVAASEGRFEDEGWRIRKDGSRFWATVVITALRDEDGTLVGFGKVTRDLTERVRAEQERVQLAHAEEAVRLRDEFLSLASHELKTPLTALHLQLDDVHRRAAELPPLVTTRLERMRRTVGRLTGLIDTLLDLSRIEVGHFVLKLESGDLRDLATEVLTRMEITAQRQGCDLRLVAPAAAPAVFDPLRINQLLDNLLANAVKYGAAAPVEVAVLPQGDVVRLEVRDRGPGVPEADRARIFERFERAVSMRNYGGLGIGLYLAREIARAHGGTVEVRDREGGGSVFSAILPAAPRP
jgi:PAS domain S-box-containing protein